MLWAVFILYRYLQQYPLSFAVFESVLPSQTFFPAISVLLNELWNLFLWCGILAGAFAAGFYLLGLLKLNWHSVLERFVFSVSVGYAVLSLLILALAAVHFLYPAVMIGLWLAGVGAFAWLIRSTENRVILVQIKREGFSFIFKENFVMFRVFVWIFLAVGLMMAFVPELFYDALVYHLGVPNLYLQEHGLVRIPGATSKFPLLWQTLYAFGLSLTDEMIPKLMHWSSGLLILLGCGSLAKRFALGQAGIFAGLVFLSVPMVQMNLWTAGIDVGSCLYAFLAVYALIVWIDQKKVLNRPPEETRSWIILTALMSGFCFGSKYQGGMIAAALFLIWIVFQLMMEPKNIKAFIIDALWFGIVLTLTICPWLAKNFWDTGNPLFPFLSPVFDKLKLQTYHMDPEQWVAFIGENRRYLVDSWKDYWQLPWIWTFKADQQSSLSYPGSFFLAFLPLTFLAFKNFKERWIQLLAAFLGLFFIFSFNSTHLTRYHLQGYPALCFFYGMGFSILWAKKDAFSKLSKVLFSVIFFLIMLENLQTGIFIMQNSYRPWDLLAGQESRESYRMYTHSGLNPYPSNVMFRWMEKNLPRNTRTLFIGESKPFDLQRPYLYTDVHGQNPLITWSTQTSSPDDLYKKFQERGITHLLVNFVEAYRTYGYKMIKWEPESYRNFELFWNSHVRQAHQEVIPERLFRSQPEGIMLYEVLPEDAAKAKGAPPVNPLAVLKEMHKS